MASNRRSLYPLPASSYPQPQFDPCPYYETTYGHEFASHKCEDHYRSRTLSAEAQDFSGRGQQTMFQGIYPRHGTGQFSLPYFRRDSKGYRKSYTQPAHVDINYLRFTDYMRQQQLGGSYAAPDNCSDNQQQPPQQQQQAYSVRSEVVGGVQFDAGNEKSPICQRRHTSDPVTEELARSAGRCQPVQQQAEQPKPTYTQKIQALRTQHSASKLDPLLDDPLLNAYRKPRTVYKRSFGLSQ